MNKNDSRNSATAVDYEFIPFKIEYQSYEIIFSIRRTLIE